MKQPEPGEICARAPAEERDRRVSFGRAAEECAARFLEAHGHTIVDRNWRAPGGELDIISRDGCWLVFVEVRARRGDRLGTPEESITPRKQARLAQLAESYVAACEWEGLWRIDVVALHYADDGTLHALNHLQDAVGGRGTR